MESVYERVGLITGIDPDTALRDLQVAGSEIRRLREGEANLLAELAAYRAQFTGGLTHYEHERSCVLAEIIEDLRRGYQDASQKVTEAALETKARADGRYRDWLDRMFVERRRMHELDAELARLQAGIEEARARKEHALQVLRLNEELIRVARSESGLG
jgi:multidrug resistance efflux pump